MEKRDGSQAKQGDGGGLRHQCDRGKFQASERAVGTGTRKVCFQGASARIHDFYETIVAAFHGRRVDDWSSAAEINGQTARAARATSVQRVAQDPGAAVPIPTLHATAI